MAVLDTPYNSTMRLMGKFCVKVNLSTSVSGSYYLTAEIHREPLWDKVALPTHNLFVTIWRLRLLSTGVRCLAVIDWVAAELLLWVVFCPIDLPASVRLNQDIYTASTYFQSCLPGFVA